MPYSYRMTEKNRREGQVSALLRQADFSVPLELILRYPLIAGFGTAVWIYTGDHLVALWMLSYWAAELYYYLTVRKDRPHATRADDQRAILAFFVSAICFVSMPMYLTHSELPLLSGVSLLTQMGMLVYMLWRPHLIPVVSYFDCAVIFAFATNAVFAYWDLMPDLAARLIFAGITFSIALYAAMALLRALRQLQARERMAARARDAEKMEAVARLTGGVAHDFNNLLTVVLGNMELYWHTPPGPERDALIQEATDAAQRGAHLTSQLLSYSRKAPMMPRTAPLREHVDNSLPLLKRLLPERIPLRIDIVRNAGNVAVDSAQFTTALMNLVSNAADAIGDGDSPITVSGWPLMGPKGQKSVVLSVSDRGGGMESGLETQATEPFFTTKDVGRGSGLGLSMVKGFAEQSGGRMELHNRPGEGLTVTLVLPHVVQVTEDATPTLPRDPARHAANLNAETRATGTSPDLRA